MAEANLSNTSAKQGKMAILVDSDIVHDSRVQKHYLSALDLGYEVVGLGFTNKSDFRPVDFEGVQVWNRLGLTASVYGTKLKRQRREKEPATYSLTPLSPERLANYIPKSWKSIIYPLLLIRLNWVVLRWLRKERPTSVLVNDPHFLYAATKYKRDRKEAVRLLYDSHENFDYYRHGNLNARFLWFLEKSFANEADAVSCVSPLISEVMKSNLHLRIAPSVITNCSRLDWIENANRNIRQDCGVEKDDPLLVYSGMVSSSRGTEDILDALAELQGVSMAFVVDKHPDTRLYLSQLITKRNLSSRCKVLDYVSPSQLESYLEDADVGVIALRKIDSKGRENFQYDFALPNKLFDYWNAGLRLVFSNCAEMMRVTKDDSASFPFDSNSTESLVRAITSAIGAQVSKDREPIYWENQSEILKRFYQADYNS